MTDRAAADKAYSEAVNAAEKVLQRARDAYFEKHAPANKAFNEATTPPLSKEQDMAQINELIEYPTKALAEAAAEYRQAWPRAGYGTSAGTYPTDPANPEGPHMMSASRDSSCD